MQKSAKHNPPVHQSPTSGGKVVGSKPTSPTTHPLGSGGVVGDGGGGIAKFYTKFDILHGRLVNTEEGRKRGQWHHLAKLSDADIERIRHMHENEGMGYRALAAKFEISRSHVRYICKYLRR